MLFKATVYNIGLQIGIVIYKWPPCRGQWDRDFYDKNGFKVQRFSKLEIRLDQWNQTLFLPGSMDGRKIGPLQCMAFSSGEEELNAWLEKYKQAYQELNGVPARIINFSEYLKELEMETVS